MQCIGEDAKMHVSAERRRRQPLSGEKKKTQSQKEGKRGDFKEICQLVNLTLALGGRPQRTSVPIS